MHGIQCRTSFLNVPSTYLQVVCTGDGAVGDSLDFSPPVRRNPIIRHLEDSTGFMFREDEFAEDPNTGQG